MYIKFNNDMSTLEVTNEDQDGRVAEHGAWAMTITPQGEGSIYYSMSADHALLLHHRMGKALRDKQKKL